MLALTATVTCTNLPAMAGSTSSWVALLTMQGPEQAGQAIQSMINSGPDCTVMATPCFPAFSSRCKQQGANQCLYVLLVMLELARSTHPKMGCIWPLSQLCLEQLGQMASLHCLLGKIAVQRRLLHVVRQQLLSPGRLGSHTANRRESGARHACDNFVRCLAHCTGRAQALPLICICMRRCLFPQQASMHACQETCISCRSAVGYLPPSDCDCHRQETIGEFNKIGYSTGTKGSHTPERKHEKMLIMQLVERADLPAASVKSSGIDW